MVRHADARRTKQIDYHAVADRLRAEAKSTYLRSFATVSGVPWIKLTPNLLHNWLATEFATEFETFTPIGDKATKRAKREPESIFRSFSGGVKSNRDEVVYDWQKDELRDRVSKFVRDYNGEVDRYKREGALHKIDDFVSYASIKWSRDLKLDLERGHYAKFSASNIRESIFRPFTKKFLYFDGILNEEVYSVPRFFPSSKETRENIAICCTIEAQIDFSALIVDTTPCLHVGGRQGQCFPFHVYDVDGSNRRENITDWARDQFRTHYKDKKISKWDIFQYVYGLLHHPGYREKFADNLKRELPRIPFAPDFGAFAKAGKKLADLHLNYESAREFPLKEIVTPGTPRSPRVESKLKLTKDKTALMVNESLTLSGIPSETFEYRLGNRSALDWVIDQYQVYTDKRTGITSDPNAWGDEHGNPEYIVELVARVITVSLETLKIVKELPREYAN